MFFRIFILSFVVIFSSNVLANGYCDSRPTQSERQRCYNNIVDPNKAQKLGNYNSAVTKMFNAKNKISSSPNISKDKKDLINKNHLDWANELKRVCGQQNTSCMHPYVVERTKAYEDYYNKHNK